MSLLHHHTSHYHYFALCINVIQIFVRQAFSLTDVAGIRQVRLIDFGQARTLIDDDDDDDDDDDNEDDDHSSDDDDLYCQDGAEARK
jgi:hypothetical protein